MRKLSFGQGKRSLLDKIIAYVRARKIKAEIPKGVKLLDLGCGYSGELIESLAGTIERGVGIDLSVEKKPWLIKGKVDSKLPLKDSQFGVVTALAIIEHVEYPEVMLSESKRVLKPGGKLLLTTPSHLGKLPLEIMAKIGIISQAEIADHKRYYTTQTLKAALKKAGFSKVEVGHFGILWLNLMAKATK